MLEELAVTSLTCPQFGRAGAELGSEQEAAAHAQDRQRSEGQNSLRHPRWYPLQEGGALDGAGKPAVQRLVIV